MKTKKSNISGHSLPVIITTDIPYEPGIPECPAPSIFNPEGKENTDLRSQSPEGRSVKVHYSSVSSSLIWFRALGGSAALIFFLFFSFPGFGQIHLGYNFDDLQQEYPDSSLAMILTATGRVCVKLHVEDGVMFYFFNNSTNRIDICIFCPYEQENRQPQIKLHNERYKAVSDNFWTYQAKDGAMMYIRLEYNKEDDFYGFIYSDKE